MPQNGRIIALTHDYGLRIAYYGWVYVKTWPYVVDLNLLSRRNGEQGTGQITSTEFDQYFNSQIASYSYFLVTLFDELDAQPLLKSKLYDTYPIYKQGDGYVLFDLDHPMNAPQQP